MEEYCSHVVQVAIQGKQTPPSLVVPDLDFVVVSSGHEQGLSRVEVNTSNGAIMLFKAVNKSSYAIVP